MENGQRTLVISKGALEITGQFHCEAQLGDVTAKGQPVNITVDNGTGFFK